MLKDKVAVIYGAGGAIGGAVARAFAREGAKLFLTGRLLAPVEAVAKDIVAAGGSAEAAEVDALDEQAVDKHLQSVIDKAGRVDISFNAVGIPNAKILGVPLVELDVEQFSLPITTYATSYFLTARLAARRMVPNRSGVIMTVTALPSRTGIPLVGGYGPAMAAKEALTRDLSAELAPHGIRVVGLRPQAMPETRTIKEAFEPRAKASGMTWEQWQELLASRTHPRRLMTLEEMANVAVFMASGSRVGGESLRRDQQRDLGAYEGNRVTGHAAQLADDAHVLLPRRIGGRAAYELIKDDLVHDLSVVHVQRLGDYPGRPVPRGYSGLSMVYVVPSTPTRVRPSPAAWSATTSAIFTAGRREVGSGHFEGQVGGVVRADRSPPAARASRYTLVARVDGPRHDRLPPRRACCVGRYSPSYIGMFVAAESAKPAGRR